MLKKISVLALAGMLALPAVAAAGAGGAASGLDAQIAELTKQLEALKAQMNSMKKDQDAKLASIDERAEGWDAASRFQWSGDFRSRYDYYERDRIANNVTVTDKNEGLFTNRLRLNIRAKATENVEFKGRLAMYKAWGMQSTPGMPNNSFGNPEAWGGFPAFDGTSSRQVSDNTLLVDRAFVNWNNIGGAPVWFSIGRRPTTDGPSAQLRMNNDERMATPTAFMDWPFDGISVGYAYNNLLGVTDAPGRIRVCYGRGFDGGLQQDATGTNDTDFAGVSWDLYKKGSRFFYLQSFGAFNVFNFPDWADGSPAPGWGYTDGTRINRGNIYHTSAVYEDKYQNLNYFVTGGWSQTDPNSNGMLNNYDGMGTYSVANTSTEDGYAIHLGVRYDIPNQPFKVGAEYNHGSRYWIGMTPGHDDMYAAKLATRGDVYEVYGIYDIPGGEAISKYGKAFIRLGYQHYEYDYTGSMDWNVKPYDVDSAAERALAANAGQNVIESADQVYATFEVYF
ncbi:MAG: DUF3373 family protein [Thermodesulfobacteriota bacterium]